MADIHCGAKEIKEAESRQNRSQTKLELCHLPETEKISHHNLSVQRPKRKRKKKAILQSDSGSYDYLLESIYSILQHSGCMEAEVGKLYINWFDRKCNLRLKRVRFV